MGFRPSINRSGWASARRWKDRGRSATSHLRGHSTTTREAPGLCPWKSEGGGSVRSIPFGGAVCRRPPCAHKRYGTRSRLLRPTLRPSREPVKSDETPRVGTCEHPPRLTLCSFYRTYSPCPGPGRKPDELQRNSDHRVVARPRRLPPTRRSSRRWQNLLGPSQAAHRPARPMSISERDTHDPR